MVRDPTLLFTILLELLSMDIVCTIALCVTVIVFKAFLIQLYQYICNKYFPMHHNASVKAVKMCDLDSMHGLDCATYMAHMFYSGYLKIILPSPGTAVKGLIEKIENYEDSNNIKIIVPKLFILIPSSSYIPPDLRDASNGWMESAQDLPNEVRNRAGVKRREYHNSVYKIYPNGKRTNKPLYLVVEGATPLLTLYEIKTRSHDETTVYQTYYKEVVKKFYEKLKRLLEDDPECTDLYELVYYDDYENGNRVNVAEVILRRLAERSYIQIEKDLRR